MTPKTSFKVFFLITLSVLFFSASVKAEEEVTDEIHPATATEIKPITPETAPAIPTVTEETSAPAALTSDITPKPLTPSEIDTGDEWNTVRSESVSSSGLDIVVRVNPKKGSIYVSPRITFDSNSNRPVSDSVRSLRKLAQELKRKPNLRLRIEGHTDSIGYDQNNMDLSQKRADEVKTILIKYGIAADRLETVGLGDRHPLAGSSTPEGQELNRRVELKIIGGLPASSTPTTATPAVPAKPAVPAVPAKPATPAIPAQPAKPAPQAIPSPPPVATLPTPSTQPTTQPTTLPAQPLAH